MIQLISEHFNACRYPTFTPSMSAPVGLLSSSSLSSIIVTNAKDREEVLKDIIEEIRRDLSRQTSMLIVELFIAQI